jgi:DNA-binding MarR family transcriptional regulator
MDSATFEETSLRRTKEAIPDLDESAFRVGFNLVRAANSLIQASEDKIHRPSGWSWAGFRVMYIIWISGEITARDISRLASVTRQTMSSVLATLERDGLVERTRDAADRRLMAVRLTSTGNDGVRAAMKAQNELEATRLSFLTAEERHTLGLLLEKTLQHSPALLEETP